LSSGGAPPFPANTGAHFQLKNAPSNKQQPKSCCPEKESLCVCFFPARNHFEEGRLRLA
jgi:hypothetical protein